MTVMKRVHCVRFLAHGLAIFYFKINPNVLKDPKGPENINLFKGYI